MELGPKDDGYSSSGNMRDQMVIEKQGKKIIVFNKGSDHLKMLVTHCTLSKFGMLCINPMCWSLMTENGLIINIWLL